MKANDPMNPEETAASLNGPAKADALHALRVLSETADTPPDDAETPPLPETLRDQWREAYGENTKAEPAATREGWWRRLVRGIATPRGAWAGGLAAAAVIAVMMMRPDVPVDGPGGTVVTRGGGQGTASANVARLVVVAAADKAGPLLTELGRAFPSRRIERMDVVPTGAGATDAIIIDTEKLGVWRNNPPAATVLKADPLANPDSVIMAVEAMDEVAVPR
jgi:hypothetical protein